MKRDLIISCNFILRSYSCHCAADELESAKFKLFKDFSFYHRSTSFEQIGSSYNLAVQLKHYLENM